MTNSTVRTLAAAAAVTATTTTVLLTGASIATAAPAPQTPSLLGPDIRPFSRPDCPGTINTAFDTDPARPGIVTVALTPTGVYGSNPSCGAGLGIGWLNGIAPFAHDQRVTLDAPGTVRLDIFAGTGVSFFTVQSLIDPANGVGTYLLAP
ncbi:hypothetical protein ACNHUS_35210 [Actinomycetes bacterium M1A6_2h]